MVLVPEARFRIKATVGCPITNLRIKVVYLEVHSQEHVEILSEDTQYVVSTSDRPLEKGFSKVVLSKSSKGYRLNRDNVAATTAALSRDAKAELHFDAGDGFRKFKTVMIEKKVVD